MLLQLSSKVRRLQHIVSNSQKERKPDNTQNNHREVKKEPRSSRCLFMPNTTRELRLSISHSTLVTRGAQLNLDQKWGGHKLTTERGVRRACYSHLMTNGEGGPWPEATLDKEKAYKDHLLIVLRLERPLQQKKAYSSYCKPGGRKQQQSHLCQGTHS